MPFPSVAATATSSVNTAGTSHQVTLPSGITGDPGEIIVILLDKGSTAATFNALTGWTEVVDENVANGITVWVRDTDATEGGSVTFTSSASTRSAHNTYRITSALAPGTQLPELSTVATGATANPNATTCTPTGGAKNYLWITFFGSAGEQADDGTLVSVTPTNYANTLTKTCGTAGTNLGGCIGSARRTNNASTEDAAAWTISETLGWRAYTLAVHPDPAVALSGASEAIGEVVGDLTITPTPHEVRSFAAASTDNIRWSSGGLSGMTYGTIAMLFKFPDAAGTRTIISGLTSGGAYLFTPAQIQGVESLLWDNSVVSTTWTSTALPVDVWLLMVLRKGTGNVTPRRSFFNLSTRTWTHENAPGSVTDWAALTGTDLIGMSTDSSGGENYEGLMGVMAVWSNEVHWSADSTGDTAIESANLHRALQNWVDETPDALWAFDQTAVTTAVDDLVGTSDQSARSGTTVVTNDPPSGFDWSLAAAVDVEGVVEAVGDVAGDLSITKAFAGQVDGVGEVAGDIIRAVALVSASGQRPVNIIDGGNSATQPTDIIDSGGSPRPTDAYDATASDAPDVVSEVASVLSADRAIAGAVEVVGAVAGDLTVTAGGDQSITPGVITAPATVLAPTVAATATITPNVVTASATVQALTVAAIATIAPGVISATATVLAPTVTASATITPNVITASATVLTPTVVAGSVTVTLGVITASATVLQPTVLQAQTVTPDVINAAATVRTPTITVGPVNVTLPVLDAAATVQSLTVASTYTVTLNVVTAPSTLLAPQVARAITAPAINASATVLSPTVVVGAVTVSLQLITAAATILAPIFISQAADPYPHKISFTDPSYAVQHADASYSIPSLESGGIIGYVEPDASIEYVSASGSISHTDSPGTIEYRES